MSETPESQSKPRSPFRTVTFGGYNRADVDAYLADMTRAATIERDHLETTKKLNETLRAQLEADRQERELIAAQQEVRLQEALGLARTLRDDLDRTRLELANAEDSLASVREERDTYQRLAERLSVEEHQTHEVLRAATRAAEQIQEEAKREADEMLARTEEASRTMEALARRRVDDLRKEYERARKDYDDFLKQAKEVAEALVRRIDDSRGKWPA